MKNLLIVTFAVICTFGLCQCQAEGEFLTPVIPEDGIYQEARIFYGYVAQPRQFPHMCSLLNRKTTGVYTLCGGSLISQRHIITAGQLLLYFNNLNLFHQSIFYSQSTNIKTLFFYIIFFSTLC